MANPYYNFPDPFIPGTKVRSDQVNVQYQSLEAAFDKLPADDEAINRGTATFAGISGGTGAIYTLTAPNPRGSTDNDGDEIVFIVDRVNTGSVSLNVAGGARPLVRADGANLAANDFQVGLMYAARYDDANSRWILQTPSASYLTNAAASAAAAAASAAAALVSEGNAATSETNSANSAAASETSRSLSEEWATNPINDDISSDPGQFSSLHWAFGAKDWALRAEDDPIPVNFGGDGSTEFSAFHWAQKASAASGLPLSPATGETLFYNGVNWAATAGWTVDETGQVLGTNFTGAMQVPAGTVAQRPGTPSNGQVRYNSDENRFEFYENGAWRTGQGVGGTSLQTTFDFNASTATADPGTKQFAYNNATPASVTEIYVSDLSVDDFNMDTIFGFLNAGDRIYLQENGNPANAYVWTLTAAPTDNTGWWTLPVAPDTVSATLPTAGAPCVWILLFGPDGSTINLGNLADVTDNAVDGQLLYKSGGIWQSSGALTLDQAASQNNTLMLDADTGFDSVLALAENGANKVRAFWDSSAATFKIRTVDASSQIRLEQGNGASIMATFDSAGPANIYHNGSQAFNTTVFGFNARPGIGADTVIGLANSAGANTAVLQTLTGTLYLDNLNNGLPVTIRGDDAGGTTRILFTADPDGGSSMPFNGANSFVMGQSGPIFYDAGAASQAPLLAMHGNDGTRNAYLWANRTGGYLELVSEQHGSTVRFLGEDTGGVLRTLYIADPDGGQLFYYAGTLTAAVNATGVQVTGTTLDLMNAGAVNTNARVWNSQGGLALSARSTAETRITRLNSAGAEVGTYATFVSGGSATLHHLDLPRIETTSSGLYVNGATGLGTANLFLRDSALAVRTRMYATAAVYGIRSEIHGGVIRVEGETTGGVLTTLADFDPDAAFIGVYADTVANAARFGRDTDQYNAIFGSGGGNFFQSISSTGNTKSLLIRATTDDAGTAGTSEPTIQHRLRTNLDELTVSVDNINFHGNRLDTGTTLFNVRGSGSANQMQFQNSSGTIRGRIEWSSALMDIDSVTNNIPLRLLSGGTVGIIVDENATADVTLYHNTVDEFRVADSNANYNSSGAEVKDHSQVWRDVGFNVMAVDEQDTSRSLNESDAGRMVHRDGTANMTITLPSGTSGAVPPVGATVMISNEGSSGTLTISPAATLRWFNGDGTAPDTGSRTLARAGVCTVYKYASTEWWIWGNGLA